MMFPLSPKTVFSVLAATLASTLFAEDLREVSKDLTVDQRYLIWPVDSKTDARTRVFLTSGDGQPPLTYFDLSLTTDPKFWAFTDLANFQGQRIRVHALIRPDQMSAWDQVKLCGTFPGEESLRREKTRPLYHFAARRGWLNDPNGLVFYEGSWHLFFQHNPYSTRWGNMHWGHATSPDLIHWTEQPAALFPQAEGVMFSGSGFVVDQAQTSIPLPGGRAIGLAYTAEGTFSFLPDRKAVQSLAISSDGGRTFQKYAGNPVLPHVIKGNRDPKVFWHEPTKSWVMVLYLDGPDYGIFTSSDLVKWTQTDTYQIPGDTECPDLFPLTMEGNSKDRRWVAWGANGRYLLGKFDGKKFTATSPAQRHYFGQVYAGQSYDHAPDNRRVHFGWMRGDETTDAFFNQQMSLPLEFTLREVDSKARLWIEPCAEIEALRTDTKEWKNLRYRTGDPAPWTKVEGRAFEVDAVIDANSSAHAMGFRLFGEYPAVWKRDDQSFTGAEGPQPPVGGKLHIRIFVDTISMEVFVNGTYIARYIRPSPDSAPIQIVAEGGDVKFDRLEIHRLKPAW